MEGGDSPLLPFSALGIGSGPPPKRGAPGGTPNVRLQTGERIANISSKHLGREGRGNIKFRIVGDHSSAWAEAASLWGGTVDCIVHSRAANHFFNSALHLPSSVTEACARGPPFVGDSDWDGILLATLSSEEEAHLAGRLFHLWRPLIAIYAPTPGLPRKTKSQWLETAAGLGHSPDLSDLYSATFVDRPHSYFGGVTLARGSFAYYTRSTEGVSRASIMTAQQFDRPLQTALDDTLGGQKGAVFEGLPSGEDARDGRVGRAKHGKGMTWQPVYDGRAKAPDIGSSPPDEGRRIWVIANTVFATRLYANREGCLRQINDAEVLSLWDYEGKESTKWWGDDLRRVIISARLASPPAKMIRSFVFTAGDSLHLKAQPAVATMTELGIDAGVGRTRDVPFAALEDAAC